MQLAKVPSFGCSFPKSSRTAYARPVKLGVLEHWVFAALITMLGEVVIEAFPGWTVFAFFAAFMVLQLLFTHFMMPETKGVSLEEPQDQLTSKDA